MFSQRYSTERTQQNECTPSTLLYFSEDADNDCLLQGFLIRLGFRLRVVETAQEVANILLTADAADALVIHQDHIDTGSMIGMAFKLLSPQVPVILLSAQPPLTNVMPLGVDALCCGDVRDYYAAQRVADGIWQLIGTPGTVVNTVPVGDLAYHT